MKNDRNSSPDSGRRQFIRSSLVAGVGAATAATLPGAAVAAPDTDTIEAERSESGQRGYRLSRHILDYYRTAAS